MNDEISAQEMQEMETPQSLTVALLIAELQKLPPNAEVACSIFGFGMTLPIRLIEKITADDKEFILMIVSPESVKMAFSAEQEPLEPDELIQKIN